MKANFGFKKVNVKDKEPKVQKVFTTVSEKYDLMNDLMSIGLHRLWKKKLIDLIHPTSEDILLDLAGGTGDVAFKFIKSGGKKAIIYDLNKEMMEIGKEKLINTMYTKRNKVEFIHGNAEKLSFQANKFDYCTISFGIRNVTYPKKVIKEAHRILKPGGQFFCMEFFNIENKLISKLYDLYSFNIILKIGKLVSNSETSYSYFVESIRKFHKPSEIINLMEEVGFSDVKCKKLSFGIVNIIYGYKIS